MESSTVQPANPTASQGNNCDVGIVVLILIPMFVAFIIHFVLPFPKNTDGTHMGSEHS